LLGITMRIAIVGAGLMGRAAALDLADDLVSPNVESVLVADIDGDRAGRVAEEAKSLTTYKEVRHAKLDATRLDEVISALREFKADVVIDAALYTTIPVVMRAALEAKVHYLDLGDDVETLLAQKEMDHQFKSEGLVALLEMGGSPGLINVMAAKAVRELDRIETLLLREGWIDLNDYDSMGVPLPVPYSLDTIFDELEQPVEVWKDGRIELVEPFSGREVMTFPPPVGEQELYYVEHPEVYSLGETFRGKGLRFVDYKLSFPRDLLLKYKLLHDLGLTSTRPVRLGGVSVIPRDIVRELILDSLKGKAFKPNDHDVMRVIARGWRGGVRAEVLVEALISWSERWNVSAQALLVGSPASLAAQWIGLGILSLPGVHYPEEVIDPGPFLDEMKRRGMEFRERVLLNI